MSEPPCIVIRGATVQYGTVGALRDVDITIRTGERVALVGPSGAGKSTLIALCNASQAPSSGAVELFGSNPEGLSRRSRQSLRRRIGTAHQGSHMPGSLRVVHNVNAGNLGRWSTRRALQSLLVRPSGVDVAVAALDLFGIGHLVWRRTDELSGGERQRVALARLVVQGAQLVLADEPTASLDPGRAAEVVQLLVGLTAGGERTVVVSIHDFDLARDHFDRLIGLRNGEVVFDMPAGSVTDDERLELYAVDGAR